jgi:hypothetical protein
MRMGVPASAMEKFQSLPRSSDPAPLFNGQSPAAPSGAQALIQQIESGWIDHLPVACR